MGFMDPNTFTITPGNAVTGCWKGTAQKYRTGEIGKLGLAVT